MILYVNACVRKESRTKRLADHALGRLGGELSEVDLNSIKPPMLDSSLLEKRERLLEQGRYGDELFALARQFAKADTVLIAAPYWDLSFPSLLKAYFENVLVCGITFVYSEDGTPKSFCKARKMIYLTTSGGPIVSDEFGFGYVRALAENFFDIKDILYIKAEGLDIFDADVGAILLDAKNRIDKALSPEAK